MHYLLLLALLIPLNVSAATFGIERTMHEDVQQVRVLLLASSTPINAVEGTLVLPDGARIDDLYTGGSIIQNWLEVPREADGAIRFAGIIPGGFVGSASAGSGLTGPATLFSFILRGDGELSLTEASVYVNDGLGTKIAIAPGEVASTQGYVALPEEDRTPPEYVEATPLRDSNIADGKFALLLDSYDGQSGIDYFEVQEGGGQWKRSESVYVVEDRYGFEHVLVRAYDRAGNYVEIFVPGRNSGLLNLAYALIALIVLLLALYLRKRRS
ncbi:MAG: hypothetical protein KBD05_00270 [Candidatus Pacebacteria bacterium]|nr:hypothetical protein [Candidatus Paceibacterota bacterium]